VRRRLATVNDVSGEKPRSREGILSRYRFSGSLRTPSTSHPFYAQLYRNVVFAIHIANELQVPWRLVNLVCARRFDEQQRQIEFRDPTDFIRAILSDNSSDQFAFYSWEQLYGDHVKGNPELQDLADYMYNKSANCVRALRLQRN
jgi:hypothetical protein